MICKNCKSEVNDNALFCKHCGTFLKKDLKFCRFCNTLVDLDSLYCEYCGRDLTDNVYISFDVRVNDRNITSVGFYIDKNNKDMTYKNLLALMFSIEEIGGVLNKYREDNKVDYKSISFGSWVEGEQTDPGNPHSRYKVVYFRGVADEPLKDGLFEIDDDRLDNKYFYNEAKIVVNLETK